MVEYKRPRKDRIKQQALAVIFKSILRLFKPRSSRSDLTLSPDLPLPSLPDVPSLPRPPSALSPPTFPALSPPDLPSASIRKTVPRAGPGDTPCSGETLLRCQVKSLLQRVEEESEFPKLETHYLQQQKLCLAGKVLISPAGLLVPTPVNTPEIIGNPQLENIYGPKGEPGLSLFASVRENEAFHLPVVLDVGLDVEKVKPTEPNHRALTFDSPEKSETVASVGTATLTTRSLDLSYHENCTQEKTADDDNASEWSTHVNISSPRSEAADEDEDEFAEAKDKEEDAEDEEDEFEECNEIDDDLCDELCRELSKICVQETGEEVIAGTHIRFLYNSDDEIEEEEVIAAATSPSVLHLKGLPTPKGKHLRFPDEEDETP